MFGKKTSAKNGVKNFQRCAHKNVALELKGARQLILGAELTCPRTEDDNLPIVKARADNLVSTDRLYVHTQAWQTVGKTDGGGKMQAYNNTETAYAHLERSAGSIACANCPFVDLSPVEVSEVRANLAEDQLTIALNDRRRLDAKTTTERVIGEIAQIESDVRFPLPESPAAPAQQE